MSRDDENKSITPNQAALKMLASFLMALLLSGILIFGGAGHINWLLGWFFLTAWIIPKLAFLILLRMLDPDLLVERVTRHENTQRYDRILVPIYFVFAFGTFVVASLDGGRFRWSGDLPVVLIVMAYIIYLLGNSLAGWAINSNRFFSAESRLQTDRSQKVTSLAPIASSVILPTPRLLCSGWPLVPCLNRGGRLFRVSWQA